MDKTKEMETLELFLNKPVSSSRSVMWEFAKLDGAVVHYPKKGRRGGFVYVPGTREDRVLLVARADTVWGSDYNHYKFPKQRPFFKDGIYANSTGETGIGANDRAGCAILYLLRDMGHSLLILERQEYGLALATRELWCDFHELYNEMNRHRYMMEFDLCGADGLKYYDMPASDEFKKYMSEGFGYHEVSWDRKKSTDICEMCSSICGVNVSAGYYNESTPREKLNYKQWLNTYTKARALLEGEQPHFEEYYIDDWDFDPTDFDEEDQEAEETE